MVRWAARGGVSHGDVCIVGIQALQIHFSVSKRLPVSPASRFCKSEGLWSSKSAKLGSLSSVWTEVRPLVLLPSPVVLAVYFKLGEQ